MLNLISLDCTSLNVEFRRERKNGMEKMSGLDARFSYSFLIGCACIDNKHMKYSAVKVKKTRLRFLKMGPFRGVFNK